MKYYLIKEKDVQEGKYIPHQLIQREIARVELTEEDIKDILHYLPNSALTPYDKLRKVLE